MIKESLSEFREIKSSSSSTIRNGKEDSAAFSSDAYKKNGKGVRVTVADTNKTKPVALLEKTAAAGCLSMFCHVDATDWCPHGDIIQCLSQFFTKEVRVEIYPRYLVGEVWSKDHCDKPYEKDYYAFRAYAGKDYCKIFVDETETKDSVLWVMLHELAHIALASSPFLFKGYRHLTPDDYHDSDDAHERDPEEQMANSIAMSWMDMLGYGKVNYPRHWWRNRTMLNKQANRFSFMDTLRGKNVDKAREALYGATGNMRDQLSNFADNQKLRKDSYDGVFGEDGAYLKLKKLMNRDYVDEKKILEDPSNYSPEVLQAAKDTAYGLKAEIEATNVLNNATPVIQDLGGLQSDLESAQKATDLARLQTAAGLGTAGMASAYGLGKSNNKKEVPGTTKLASATTEFPYLNIYKGK